MKLPGNNTVTFCPAALMNIVQEALNARTYDSKESPVRVIGIEAIKEGDAVAFHFAVTTDEATP